MPVGSSKKSPRDSCPHCDWEGRKFLIEKHENFVVSCDKYPLCEGHLLIIPKRHVDCIAEYSKDEFAEFLSIYSKITSWLWNTYGGYAGFEHGVIGQTIFHSHVHVLPFKGKLRDILWEGMDYVAAMKSLESLFQIYKRDSQYLFLSLNGMMWTVDNALGTPRFFRDRFAAALGKPERGNWKAVQDDPDLLAQGLAENHKAHLKFSLSLNDLAKA